MDNNTDNNEYRNKRGHRVNDINNTITGEEPKKSHNHSGKSAIKIFKIFLVLIVLASIVFFAYFLINHFDFNFSSKPSKSKSNTQEIKPNNNKKSNQNKDDNSNKDDNNDDQQNPSESDEEKLFKYYNMYYLFINNDLFYKNEFVNGKIVDSNINFKSISNSYFLTTALEKLDFTDNKFVKNGFYCRYATKNNKCPVGRIKKSKVDSEIGKLFGNINYKHQSTSSYVLNGDYYYSFGDERELNFKDSDGEVFTVPYNVDKKKDIIYIYSYVGVVDYRDINNIKMYNSLDKDEAVSVNITVGRKESYFSGDWFFDNEPLDYFVKSNGHKFSQYRFTFKKVNNNYQFVNIENVK